MQKNALQSAKWLVEALKPQYTCLVWMSVLTLLKVASSLAAAVVTYVLFDSMLSETLTYEKATGFVLAVVLLIFLRYLFLCSAAFLSHKMAFSLVADTKIALAKKLLNVPLSFLSSYHSADIRQIIDDDVNRVESFVAHHFTDLLTALLTPILTVALLFYFSWPLAIVSLVPLPIAIIAQSIMFRGYAQQVQGYQDALVSMNKQSTELIQNMAASRMLQGAKGGAASLSKSVTHYVDVVNRWTEKASGSFAFLKAALDFGFILLLPVTLYLVMQQTMTLIDLMIVMVFGLTLMQPLYSLLMFSGLLNQIFEGVSRIQIIECADEAPSGHLPWPEKPGFSLRNIHYKYGGSKDVASSKTAKSELYTALCDIHLDISFGEKIAIIGESGSGKSTLLNLMAGLFLPSSGDIFCNNIPLCDYKQCDMYAHLGVVSQSSHIFHGSIRENITRDKSITDDQLWQALSLAKADGFVRQKAEQLDFVVGGQHKRLSGGEKQRLAIARVLVKQANVYLLDEATSYFDPLTEQQVMNNVFSQLMDKTIVFSTHRLENTAFADRVIVMKQGRIQGFDTHAQLLKNCGAYQDLHSRLANNNPPLGQTENKSENNMEIINA